jgi:hypothetical protein
MKKVLLVVVLVVLVLVAFLIRPNKSDNSVYSVLPANLLMSCNMADLNGEIDFINSFGFCEGDVLAPVFEECDDNERMVVELMLDVLGDDFVLAYKKGKLEEKVAADEEIVIQDVLENIIMASKPAKQVSVSFIESTLSSFVEGTVVTEYGNTTINTVGFKDCEEPVFMSYCIVDGIVVATFSLETLQQSIDLATGKVKDNFTQTKLYTKLMDGAKESDVFAMAVNMADFMDSYIGTLDALVSSEMMEDQNDSVEGLQNQMDVFKDMYDGLGYSVGYIGRTDTEFYTRSCGDFDKKKLNDFYKSIFAADNSVSDMTKFHVKDPVIAYAVNIGLQEYISLMLETLPEEQVAEVKSSFEDETNVDFDTLVGCMGNGISFGMDEFEYTTMIPNVSFRMMVGLSSKHDELMPTLETISAMSPMPLNKKNIADTEVMCAGIPMTVLEPGFAVKNDKLLFATSLDVMSELIKGVKADKSLASNVKFNEFVGNDDLFGWYYVDISKVIDAASNMYGMFKPMMADKIPEELAGNEIEDALARAKMFQQLYMKAYTKGSEYYSESIITYDKDYEPIIEEVEVIGIKQ